MPFLEATVRDLDEKFGLGVHAGALVMTFLRTMIGKKGSVGNLTAFLERLNGAGLGDLTASWVGPGENKRIEPAQFETAVGRDVIDGIATKVGLSTSVVTPALAFLAPRVVNVLTPDGEVPTALPSDVSAFLAGRTPLPATPDTTT